MKRIFLICAMICGIAVSVSSCNKGEDDNKPKQEIVDHIRLDNYTKQQIDMLCDNMGISIYGGSIVPQELLVVDSQEKLAAIAPNFAETIDLEGKMLLITAVGLKSGSASVNNALIRTDNGLVWNVVIHYPDFGTCDAPIVFTYNMYPLYNSPIDIEIIER